MFLTTFTYDDGNRLEKETLVNTFSEVLNKYVCNSDISILYFLVGIINIIIFMILKKDCDLKKLGLALGFFSTSCQIWVVSPKIVKILQNLASF